MKRENLFLLPKNSGQFFIQCFANQRVEIALRGAIIANDRNVGPIKIITDLGNENRLRNLLVRQQAQKRREAFSRIQKRIGARAERSSFALFFVRQKGRSITYAVRTGMFRSANRKTRGSILFSQPTRGDFQDGIDWESHFLLAS